MSVRAHRVSKIEYDAADTFSLSDEKLIDLFGINRYLDDDGCGIVWVSIEDIEEAIANAEEYQLDESTIESLRVDIRLAREECEEYVKYYLL